VYSPAERAVTLSPISSLLLCTVLCGLHLNLPGLADVSGEVWPDLLRPAGLAADGRQLIRHLYDRIAECGSANLAFLEETSVSDPLWSQCGSGAYNLSLC
jgi:hypothetical protein